jgi:hypothetical protein
MIRESKFPSVKLAGAWTDANESIRAAIELIYDLEDILPELNRRRLRHKHSADSQMRRRLFTGGDQRIGRLLDAITEESIGAIHADCQAHRAAAKPQKADGQR